MLWGRSFVVNMYNRDQKTFPKLLLINLTYLLVNFTDLV